MLSKVQEFESVPGQGVPGQLTGRSVLIGNRKLMAREKVPLGSLVRVAETLAADGKSSMVVVADGQLVSLVAVSDQVRLSVKVAVKALHHLGIQTVMLTDNTRRMAEAVARELGLEPVMADVLLEETSGLIKLLQVQGRVVAILCDGVNDVPAPVQADVGLAVRGGGGGSDGRRGPGPSRSGQCREAVTLAWRVRDKIKHNLFWAAGDTLPAIPFAAGALFVLPGILLRPERAGLLMSDRTVSVSLNAPSLNRLQGLRRTPVQPAPS